jgi:hypothetical protein
MDTPLSVKRAAIKHESAYGPCHRPRSKLTALADEAFLVYNKAEADEAKPSRSEVWLFDLGMGASHLLDAGSVAPLFLLTPGPPLGSTPLN